MRRNALLIGALLLTLLVCTSSCKKRQHIRSVSKGLIVFSYTGGDDVFTIDADCEWTIEVESSADWITVNPTSGANEANIAVSVEWNHTNADRSTLLTVVSANGKAKKEVQVLQTVPDISAITNKVWFLRNYERWDTDYFNTVIPESYREYTYYTNAEYENWYFYFYENQTGFQIHTENYDTIYYPYEYVFYPDGDSLFISFETEGSDQREDYRAVIHRLDNEDFVFSNLYRAHQYEKLFMKNASASKATPLKPNPKKFRKKPAGPLIPVK